MHLKSPCLNEILESLDLFIKAFYLALINKDYSDINMQILLSYISKYKLEAWVKRTVNLQNELTYLTIEAINKLEYVSSNKTLRLDTLFLQYLNSQIYLQASKKIDPLDTKYLSLPEMSCIDYHYDYFLYKNVSLTNYEKFLLETIYIENIKDRLALSKRLSLSERQIRKDLECLKNRFELIMIPKVDWVSPLRLV